jgi:hypothetical protein
MPYNVHIHRLQDPCLDHFLCLRECRNGYYNGLMDRVVGTMDPEDAEWSLLIMADYIREIRFLVHGVPPLLEGKDAYNNW